MSSVDNRIVEMQFNNKRFEENAKQTMSTLDKLKEKLSFKSATKEMSDFQNTADSFNLSHIASAVDEIGDKFTLLGNLGQQAMQRIANAAIDAGVSLVKSISVDQMSAGMQKYEQETNTVQALYAALKPKGKSLEDIYGVLDKLTEYSDETSYSYAQMADGVSKFVAAGQDIDKSELVMEGIANAAALAGVSIQDAGIAFRNFSDAMGKGAFQLQDWKSIQNIHMDTEAFKNEVLETAAALGKLEKDANGVYWITTGTGKTAKKQEINAANFGEYLRYDFFDRDVIMATMEKYADRTTELGDTAFKAAQQAKTFTDVMDAVKDAVSTQWKSSFKIIFGDLNEAIDLFTPMANAIIEFTSSIDEFRNHILTKWKDAGGRDSMIGTLENIWETFNWFTEQFKFAVFDVFRPSLEEMDELGALDFGDYLGKKLAKVTEGIKDATQAFKEWLQGANTADGQRRIAQFRSIFGGILSVVNIVKMAFDAVGTFISEIFEQLKPTFDEILSLLGLVGGDLLGLNNDLKSQKGFTELAKNLAAIFKPLTDRLPKVIRKIKKFYLRLKEIWNTNPRVVAFRNSVQNVIDAFVKFLPNAIDSVIEFGKRLYEMVKNSDEWKRLVDNYNKYIKPVINFIANAATKFNNSLADFFNMDTSDENTLWGKIKKRFSAFDNLGPWLAEKWEAAKKQIPWLQDVEDWWNTDPVINEIKEWVNQIAHAVDVFLSEDTSGETSIVGKIKKRFEAMWAELGPWLSSKWDTYKEKYPILQQIEDFLGSLFGWGKPAEEAAQETEAQTERTTGFLQKAWDAISEFIGKIDPGKLILFGMAMKVLVDVYKKIKTLAGWASLGETIGETFEELGKTLKEARKSMKSSRMSQTVTSILGVALSIWLLGKTLIDVAQLSWDEIGRGLTAMAGLFVEEGAFMVLMNNLSKSNKKSNKGIKIGQMIGIGISMWLLAKALETVAALDWPQIGTGLTGMAGLFAETGAFTVLVNRFGKTSIFSKKGFNSASIIATAVSMMILGNTLKSLAEMTWEEIGRGLSTMGGLFLETGAFTILVNRLGSVSITQKKGTSGILLTAISIKLLANTLKSLGEMQWDEIGRGLAAMAGLFVEEGAFMAIIGFLSKKDAINPGAVNATTGILSAGIGVMGDAMAKLGQLSLKQILKGALALAAIEVMLGVFVGVMSEFETVKISQALGMVLFAGAIFIMAKAFEPLAKLSLEEIGKGVLALASVAVALGIFCYAMSGLEMSLKTTLGVIVGAIAMAALMVAFAFAISQIKDVDAGTILAFGAAMILVSGAMAALSAALQVFSKMSIGAAVKGTAIMLIAAVGLAAAVGLILEIVGSSIQDFSNNIAVVGANLAQYSDQVAGIDMTAVNNSITMIKDLAAAFVIVGAKDYGNLEVFRTNVTRISSSLKIFGMNTAEVDTEKMKSITATLKQMAGDLAGFPEVSDVGTSIGNIGGAIKLYSESLNGVDLSTAPDTTAIKQVFDTLKGALPNDENLTEVAGYAAEGKGDDMTNFAIGLTNIATAVSSFSESAKDLDFTNITNATSALTAISQLDTGLKTTTVSSIGPFATEITAEKMPLSTFAEDIVALGTALQAFGENISLVSTDDLTTGTTVLKKIVEVNKALPKTGGISSWITGSQNLTNFAANLRLLGGGAKEFGEAVSGSTFDATSVAAAGDALIKIAEVNAKLPKTGGISSWFSGDEDLSGFGKSLKDLGEGVAGFAEGLGETTINDNIKAAVEFIRKLANVQVRLSGTDSWYTLGSLAYDMVTVATNLKTANETLTGITWANTEGFEHILDFATEQQVKLGSTKYSKTLKNIGQDLKDFFNEIWGFTSTWTGSDSGKLDKVANAVTGIFTSLNEAFANANSDGSFTATGVDIMKYVTEGISSEVAKSGAIKAVQAICKSLWETVHPGNDKNYYNAGTWVPEGFGRGIKDNRYAAINAAVAVMRAAIKAAQDEAGIASPSKVFAEMGMYSDMGLAQGLTKSVGIVEQAGRTVSRSAIGSVLDGMMDITNLPLEEMDITPTIRPVLDTSDISSRAGLIDGLLGGARNIGFNTSKLEAQAQILGDATAPDLATITQRVSDLGSKLDTLGEAITHMQIVLNNGLLVGAIASDMDQALGARNRMAERGG